MNELISSGGEKIIVVVVGSNSVFILGGLVVLGSGIAAKNDITILNNVK